MVDLFNRESVFGFSDVIRPLPECIRVFPIPIRSCVINTVDPVMEAVVVLHAALPGAELDFAFNDLDDGIESALITEKQQVLCQYPGDDDAVSTRPRTGGIHVRSAYNWLRLFYELIRQLFADDQHEVYEIGRGGDLVVMPVVAEEVVIHPVFKGGDYPFFYGFVPIVF